MMTNPPMKTQEEESREYKAQGLCGDTADGKLLSVVCKLRAGHKGDHWCPAAIWPRENTPTSPKGEWDGRCESCNGPILSHHKTNHWQGYKLHTACYAHAKQTERLFAKLLLRERQRILEETKRMINSVISTNDDDDEYITVKDLSDLYDELNKRLANP